MGKTNPKAQSTTSQRAQHNLTKTVVLVSVGFFLCYTGDACYTLAYNTGVTVTFAGPLFNFTSVMVALHCCINPFIYIANYEQFRSTVRKVFGMQANTVFITTTT